MKEHPFVKNINSFTSFNQSPLPSILGGNKDGIFMFNPTVNNSNRVQTRNSIIKDGDIVDDFLKVSNAQPSSLTRMYANDSIFGFDPLGRTRKSQVIFGSNNQTPSNRFQKGQKKEDQLKGGHQQMSYQNYSIS